MKIDMNKFGFLAIYFIAMYFAWVFMAGSTMFYIEWFKGYLDFEYALINGFFVPCFLWVAMWAFKKFYER